MDKENMLMLLEILHIVHNDGMFSDKEILLDFLRDKGVDEVEIQRHTR